MLFQIVSFIYFNSFQNCTLKWEINLKDLPLKLFFIPLLLFSMHTVMFTATDKTDEGLEMKPYLTLSCIQDKPRPKTWNIPIRTRTSLHWKTNSAGLFNTHKQTDTQNKHQKYLLWRHHFLYCNVVCTLKETSHLFTKGVQLFLSV